MAGVVIDCPECQGTGFGLVPEKCDLCGGPPGRILGPQTFKIARERYPAWNAYLSWNDYERYAGSELTRAQDEVTSLKQTPKDRYGWRPWHPVASDATDDCLRCCLATMLRLPLDEVPHFVEIYEGLWYSEMKKWLLENWNIDVIGFDGHYAHKGLYLVDGWTERDSSHIVMYENGEFSWDPHSSQSGLVSIRRTYWFIHTDLGAIL